MKTGPEGLEVIDPAVTRERVVPFRGERIVVRPLTIARLPRFAAAVEPLVADLAKSDKVATDFSLGDFLGWIGAYGEPLIAAAAVAIDREVAWVGDGDPAEFSGLIAAVFAVNADFFARRLVPTLTADLHAVAGALAASAGAGPKQ